MVNQFIARVPGKFKLRAKARLLGRELLSAERDLEIQFPSIAEVMSGAGVSARMSSTWLLAALGSGPTGCREDGYYISLNTDTGSFADVEYRAGTLQPYGSCIARPAISEKRLSLSPQGRVHYQLKTPWRNGTTHVEWNPADFIAKLAALVPPPRAHLTRFQGIFAPNSSRRAQLTPSGRGKKSAADAESTRASPDERTPDQRRRSMTWAKPLKRVFGIDVSTCVHCGGAVRIVASIEEPNAIRAILGHLAKHGALEEAHYRPRPRGPPAVAMAA